MSNQRLFGYMLPKTASELVIVFAGLALGGTGAAYLGSAMAEKAFGPLRAKAVSCPTTKTPDACLKNKSATLN